MDNFRVVNTQYQYIDETIDEEGTVLDNKFVNITGDGINITNNAYLNEWYLPCTSNLNNKALEFDEIVNNGSIINRTAYYGERRLELGTWYPDTGDQPIQETSAVLTNQYLQTQVFDNTGVVVGMSMVRGEGLGGQGTALYYADTLVYEDMQGVQKLNISSYGGIVSTSNDPFKFTTQSGLQLNNGTPTEGQLFSADASGNPTWIDPPPSGWVGTATTDLDMATNNINNVTSISVTDIYANYNINVTNSSYDPTTTADLSANYLTMNSIGSPVSFPHNYTLYGGDGVSNISFTDATTVDVLDFHPTYINFWHTDPSFTQKNVAEYHPDHMMLTDGSDTTPNLITNITPNQLHMSNSGTIDTYVDNTGVGITKSSFTTTQLTSDGLIFNADDGTDRLKIDNQGITTYYGQDLNIVTSGTMTLQGGTGSIGQVVKIDSDGKPRWKDDASGWAGTATSPLDMSSYAISNVPSITAITSTDLNMNGQVVFDTPPHIPDPIFGNDAASKGYVDTLIGNYSGNGLTLYLNFDTSHSNPIIAPATGSLGQTLVPVIPPTTGNYYTLRSVAAGTDTLISTFTTAVGYPNTLSIPAGLWSLLIWGYSTGTGGQLYYHFHLDEVTSTGVLVGAIGTSGYSSDVNATSSSDPDAYHCSLSIVNGYTMASVSNRIRVQIYTTGTGSVPTYLYTLFGGDYYTNITTTLNGNLALLTSNNTWTGTNTYSLGITSPSLTTSGTLAIGTTGQATTLSGNVDIPTSFTVGSGAYRFYGGEGSRTTAVSLNMGTTGWIYNIIMTMSLTGSTAGQTLTLPTAVNGYYLYIVNSSSQNWTITCQSGDSIYQGLGGVGSSSIVLVPNKTIYLSQVAHAFVWVSESVSDTSLQVSGLTVNGSLSMGVNAITGSSMDVASTGNLTLGGTNASIILGNTGHTTTIRGSTLTLGGTQSNGQVLTSNGTTCSFANTPASTWVGTASTDLTMGANAISGSSMDSVASGTLTLAGTNVNVIVGNTSHTSTIRGSTVSINASSSTGTVGQVLTAGGSGTCTWATPTGGWNGTATTNLAMGTNTIGGTTTLGISTPIAPIGLTYTAANGINDTTVIGYRTTFLSNSSASTSTSANVASNLATFTSVPVGVWLFEINFVQNSINISQAFYSLSQTSATQDFTRCAGVVTTGNATYGRLTAIVSVASVGSVFFVGQSASASVSLTQLYATRTRIA